MRLIWTLIDKYGANNSRTRNEEWASSTCGAISMTYFPIILVVDFIDHLTLWQNLVVKYAFEIEERTQ